MNDSQYLLSDYPLDSVLHHRYSRITSEEDDRLKLVLSQLILAFTSVVGFLSAHLGHTSKLKRIDDRFAESGCLLCTDLLELGS